MISSSLVFNLLCIVAFVSAGPIKPTTQSSNTDYDDNDDATAVVTSDTTSDDENSAVNTKNQQQFMYHYPAPNEIPAEVPNYDNEKDMETNQKPVRINLANAMRIDNVRSPFVQVPVMTDRSQVEHVELGEPLYRADLPMFDVNILRRMQKQKQLAQLSLS